MKRIELCGKRFGRLIVEEYLGNCYYLCKCDCGNYKKVFSGNLMNGDIKSCGCLRKETTGNLKRSHNGKGTRIYNTWCKMKRRCENPSDDQYRLYGGRGISVCDEWHDFATFRDWAFQNGYDDSLSIDRINVNGNYCPENCRWATNEQQANNKQDTIYITHNGKTKCVTEWSKETGINACTIRERYHRGLEPAEIFSQKRCRKNSGMVNAFRNAYRGGERIVP